MPAAEKAGLGIVTIKAFARGELLKEQGWQVSRLLNGYLRWLRDRKAGQALALHEDSITYADKGDDLDEWLAGLPL